MEDVDNAADDLELLEILQKTKDNEIQTAAFNKIERESTLYRVAIDPMVSEEFRYSALDRIDDQQILFDIIRHFNPSSQLKMKAVRKISDEQILVSIAMGKPKSLMIRLREAAVSAIRDKGNLFLIARNCNHLQVRLAAVKRIDDGEKLFELASSLKNNETALAAVRKIVSQADLVKLAAHDSYDVTVRQEAVRGLNAQQLLFDLAIHPAEKKHGVAVNIAAVNRIDDELMLVDIVRTTRSRAVGRAALEKISSQKSFIDIMISNSTSTENDRVRILAVAYLNDMGLLLHLLKNNHLEKDLARAGTARLDRQEDLLDLAENAVDLDCRKAAVARIDDELKLVSLLKGGPRHGSDNEYILERIRSQQALAKLINADLGNEIRLEAVKKLTSDEAINAIVVNHQNSVIREALTGKVTRRESLFWLARQDSCPYVRRAATVHIFDQKVLVGIAGSDPSSAVRRAAVERIQDQDVLLAVAQKDSSPYVRAAAAKQVGAPAISDAIKKQLPAWWDAANELSADGRIEGVSKQNDFIDIALNDKDKYRRDKAVEQVDDQDVLACVAVNDDFFITRESAVKRLDRRDVLVELARYDESDYVRAEAVRKIKDQDILLDLMKKESSNMVKEAALGGISDLDFVIRSAREEDSKSTQEVAYGRAFELMNLSIDCQSPATSSCHSCWYIGKLRMLLTEKAVRDYYGRLSLKVKAESNSQDYTGGNTMYAQTLDLSVQNSKGKHIVQVSDNSYEFPYTTSSFAPICAEADWREIYNTILEPLADSARVKLEKKYRLNVLWNNVR